MKDKERINHDFEMLTEEMMNKIQGGNEYTFSNDIPIDHTYVCQMEGDGAPDYTAHGDGRDAGSRYIICAD